MLSIQSFAKKGGGGRQDTAVPGNRPPPATSLGWCGNWHVPDLQSRSLVPTYGLTLTSRYAKSRLAWDSAAFHALRVSGPIAQALHQSNIAWGGSLPVTCWDPGTRKCCGRVWRKRSELSGRDAQFVRKCANAVGGWGWSCCPRKGIGVLKCFENCKLEWQTAENAVWIMWK